MKNIGSEKVKVLGMIHRLVLTIFWVVLLVACTSQRSTSSPSASTITPSQSTIKQTPNIDEDLPTSHLTETPLPTPPIRPTPTDDLTEGESISFEQIFSAVPLKLNVDPTAGLIAYQHDRQLWLDAADLSGSPILIAKCDGQNEIVCDRPRIHWSPDGSRFFYEAIVDDEYHLIISDLEGQKQGYRISRGPSRNPVWSPDGNKIILFVADTNRPWGDHDNGDLSALDFGFINEVWQLQLGASGTWLEQQKLTDLETPGIGCGGGGTSISDTLYDTQGGYALGYQAARQMEWSSDDVIIYPLTCDYWKGYGRLDAQTGEPLTPYSGELRGLTLDSSGSRWYAVTGHNRDEDPTNNQLVTGTSTSTTYEVIDTAVPVEMVFVGSQSGRLYYTARERFDHKDLSSQIEWNQSVPLTNFTYFNFFHTQLWTIQPDGTDERLLWESDDHSYSRLTETIEGDILFVLVENDVELYEIMASGAPSEEWPEQLPRTHIMRLPIGSPEPEIFLENARDLITWYP